MRHSLFFRNCADADKAEKLVNDDIEVTDCFQTNDGETGTIEVRFFTDARLGTFDQDYLLSKTNYNVYAFNCED